MWVKVVLKIPDPGVRPGRMAELKLQDAAFRGFVLPFECMIF